MLNFHLNILGCYRLFHRMKLILVVDMTAQETMHFQMHPKSTFIEILNSGLLQGESSLTLRIMI